MTVKQLVLCTYTDENGKTRDIMSRKCDHVRLETRANGMTYAVDAVNGETHWFIPATIEEAKALAEAEGMTVVA
jgi:hypothetical protein